MYTYTCEQCGKQFTRETKVVGYPTCKGCKKKETWQKHPKLREQEIANRKRAFESRYGVDNPSKLTSVREVLSSKAIERYKDPSQKDRITALRENTCIRKYGYRAPAMNPEIAAKGVATQRANNGFVGWENKELQERAEDLAHTEEAQKKRERTSLRNHGETHHFKNKDVLKKQWDSYRRKTGFEHPAKNPNVKHSGSKGYLFEDIHFDSSWELAYYIWLRDNDRDFIYHPAFSLEYVDDNGEAHVYWPDFLVEGQFIEIKGDHFFNEKGEPYNHYSKTFWWNKYNTLLENKVMIMKLDQVKEYLRYVKQTYGKGYLQSFKRKQSSTTIPQGSTPK